MEKIEEGVMVMKDGKAWGIEYEDGQVTSWGWINPSDTRAKIHDPRYCKSPTDVTFRGSYLEPELRTGKLAKVVRKTTVKVIGE